MPDAIRHRNAVLFFNPLSSGSLFVCVCIKTLLSLEAGRLESVLSMMTLAYCLCPHSGQKLADAEILFLHLGQILRRICERRGVPQKLQ